MAEQLGCAMVETSALDSTNVDNAFDRIVNGKIVRLILNIEIYKLSSSYDHIKDEDASIKLRNIRGTQIR